MSTIVFEPFFFVFAYFFAVLGFSIDYLDLKCEMHPHLVVFLLYSMYGFLPNIKRKIKTRITASTNIILYYFISFQVNGDGIIKRTLTLHISKFYFICTFSTFSISSHFATAVAFPSCYSNVYTNTYKELKSFEFKYVFFASLLKHTYT